MDDAAIIGFGQRVELSSSVIAGEDEEASWDA